MDGRNVAAREATNPNIIIELVLTPVGQNMHKLWK